MTASRSRPTISAADAAKFRATPVSNLILCAFDAETGKQLHASKKTIPDWCISPSRWSLRKGVCRDTRRASLCLRAEALNGLTHGCPLEMSALRQ
jgi:hypothetical protein